ADRARHHAGHPVKVQPQGPNRPRPPNLPAAQRRRAHVLPLQGLAPRRHPLRSKHQNLHGNHRHRRLRHMVALMSPDPSLRIVPFGKASQCTQGCCMGLSSFWRAAMCLARNPRVQYLMKPRIAVLGCGYWGSNHIRTLKALGALYAVSDANAARAEGFASEQDCLAIEPESLFTRDDIDAIVLALPPQFHAKAAEQAVSHGKDVLVEKPIALNVEDAVREVRAAEEHDRVFMVGHVLRFHPAFEKLKSLVDEGDLGQVRYIHSHRLGLGKFHTENDALWDLAPHDLSMILAITGNEPTEVRGEGAALLDHLSDFAHLHMRFPNDIR